MKTILRESLSASTGLTLFAAVSATLLAGIYWLTRPTIELTERQEKLRLIAQTLPAGSFDNDLVRSARPLPLDPRLGLKRSGQFYPASRAGDTVAVVLEAAAPDGYAGEIRLLVGIGIDGRVTGVRVTQHRETPGLGDYIEIGKSGWIHQFEGKSLTAPAAAAWQVKKDGGAFDSMAGATITPRAVVKAVKKALDYFAAHRDTLLSPPSTGSVKEMKHVR